MDNTDNFEKAQVLIKAIQGTFDVGGRYFNKRSKELTTVKEVLEALVRDKWVAINSAESPLLKADLNELVRMSGGK